MRKFLAPLAGASLIVLAPAAASAQPAHPAQPIAPVWVAPSVTAPAPAAKASAVDPAALTLAHQILDIGIPAEKRSQMFGSVMDSLIVQTRKATENLGLTKDKDLQALMNRSSQRMWDEMKPIMNAALPDIFDSMARAYAREFSTDDLNAILAFVRTPAGQHYFERAPNLLKDPDVQAANQRMVAQLMGKLPEIIRQNKQDIEDYAARKAKQEKAAAPKPVT